MQDWYVAQDPEVKAPFDATLLLLAATDDWEEDDVEEFKPLTERHLGPGEIRFHVRALVPGAKRHHRRRFRPVGIWPTVTEREFVLILVCEKSRMGYTPYAAFDVALTHKTFLEQGRGTIRERI